MKKDRSEKRVLSQKKKWLPLSSKHLACIMTEQEADEFIKLRGNDKIYYFFKTQAGK